MEQSGPFLNDVIRDTDHLNWLILSLIVLALAYIGIRLFFGRYWRRYHRAMFYNQEAQKLIHEKNILLLQTAVSMNILAALSIGLFLHLFSSRFIPVERLTESFYGWIFITLFVIISIGGKYIVIRILGRSGNNTPASIQINHLWLINFKNTGVFILPFSVISAFISPPLNDIVLYLGLAVLGLMLILNYIKGFVVLYQYRISIYYGILYLCTLEILPVLIIWKVVRILME